VLSTPTLVAVFRGPRVRISWQRRGNGDRGPRRQPAPAPRVRDPSGPEIADRGPIAGANNAKRPSLARGALAERTGLEPRRRNLTTPSATRPCSHVARFRRRVLPLSPARERSLPGIVATPWQRSWPSKDLHHQVVLTARNLPPISFVIDEDIRLQYEESWPTRRPCPSESTPASSPPSI
jgi:hypothetical protein